MTAPEKPVYTLAEDEKVAQVMVYTQNALFWGDVIVKTGIRVSMWLRTNAAPEVLVLQNGRTIPTIVPGKPRAYGFREIHIFVNQILAFHLVPPEQDPIDFDPMELNRYMDPVTVLVGSFRLDGNMRLSSLSNMGKYLEVTREEFTALYDVEICNTLIQEIGKLKVPYVLVRQNAVIFAKKQAA